ncbi:MAG: SH3 domain-containing protein [Gammaproteobacteria bacterium]
MKTINRLLIALVVASTVGCIKTAPIMNFQNVVYDASGPMTTFKVRQLVYAACIKAGWHAELSSPQSITATYNVGNGKQVATVEIALQSYSYDITYRDSTNLEYNPKGIIHQNYNTWVTALKAQIDDFLKHPEQMDIAALPPELLQRKHAPAVNGITKRDLPLCNDIPEQTLAGQADINRSMINLRKGAGIHCTAIAYLKRGLSVDLKGKKGDWYLVSYHDEIEGWVFSPFVTRQ